MNRSETEQEIVKVSGEAAVLAWALILVGMVILIFILNELLTAYLDVDSNAFISEMTRRFSDTTFMALGEFPVYVTESGAVFLAYFLFIPIALLGIHIAIALIRAGSQILSPAFPYQIARLKHRIDRLHQKLEGK